MSAMNLLEFSSELLAIFLSGVAVGILIGRESNKRHPAATDNCWSCDHPRIMHIKGQCYAKNCFCRSYNPNAPEVK